MNRHLARATRQPSFLSRRRRKALRDMTGLLMVLCLFIASPSHAGISIFTSLADFNAATSARSTDGYNGFDISGATGSPITRTAGSYGYTASAATGFYGAGTSGNPWLSTYTSTDPIVIGSFTGGVGAVGGLFFDSNYNGAYASGNITITAIDSTGDSVTRTITGATTSSFLGFVSTGTMLSLSITAEQTDLPNAYLWPTVDNLVLGKAAATQTFTYDTPATTINARPDSTVSLSGTLGNTGTAGLATSLSSTGTLSVTDLSPTSGTVAVSDSTTVTGTISTGSTAGAQGWQVTNTDATAANTTASISGTVNVYDYANAKYTGTALDFGHVHQGATVAAQTVAFGNETVTNASYQDLLDVSATTDNAAVTATGFTGLAASTGGATTNDLSFTVDTSTLGSLDSTATLTLTSNANGVDGLSNGTATLAQLPATITTTGFVYSGQGLWLADGGGNWNDWSKWETDGGAPGLDAGFTTTDTAAFVTGAITENTTISLNGTSPSLKALTFDHGTLSYTLDATGGGTLILNGGGSGASVTVRAGSHQISAPVTLNDNTTMTVTNAADHLTVSGAISGAGNLTKLGDGKLTLSGENTYTGNTIIDGGSLTLTGSVGTTGSTADVYVGKDNGGASLTISGGGVITNGKSVIGFGASSNANSVTLTGEDSRWNSTVTFHLGYDGSGNTMTVSDGAQFTLSNTSNFDALIGANAGSNDNVLTVTGANSSFSNENLGSTSTLYVGRSGTGNQLQILDGGQVFSFNARIGGGTGSTGTTDDNSATVSGADSAWSIGGTLRVGSNGTNSALTVSESGKVTVLGNSFVGYDAASTGNTVLVTGEGSLLDVKALTVGRNGSGTVTLADSGTLTATSISLAANADSSGTLKIGNGCYAGTLTQTTITGGLGTATVAFNHTDDIDFDSTITGTASVTKAGSGITNLTAENTYTGTTTVSSGVLAISGSLSGAGDVTVATSSYLTGGGSITTAVDHSIYLNGVLNVQSVGCNEATIFSVNTSGTGALVMGAGSVIAIDLFTGAGQGNNTAISGASDTLSLIGKLDATAGGSLLLGNPNHMTGFQSGDQWQVVDLHGGDGSITGTLAVSDAALGLSSTQTGKFDAATGTYTVVDTAGGLQTAGAQDQAIMSTMQNALGDINGRLFSLRAGGGEEEDEDDSGSISAALDYGVIVGEGDGPEDKNPIAKKVLRSRQWEVFTTVNYANVSLSGIGTQSGLDSQTWAPSVGIERHFTRGLSLGFAASFIDTHQHYANSLGTLDIQGLALSTYASYVRRSFWVDGLYSFGMLDLDSTRNAGAGLPAAIGDTTAWTNSLQFNSGWNFRFQQGTLVTGPFVGLDYMHATVDSYAETGGGIAALAYGKRDFDSLISRVGWSASKRFDTDWAVITPQLRLSYERQNMTNNNATSATLINLPFSSTTQSQSPGQDYMVLGAGVNFVFSERLSLLLSYSTQLFRQDLQAHFGAVRIGYKF